MNGVWINRLVSGAGLALLVAGAAAAQPVSGVDQVRRSLMDRGYSIVTDERTWLGRQRIVAMRGSAMREVVVIRATGEILRDYAYEMNGEGGGDLAQGVTQPEPGPTTGVTGGLLGDPPVGVSDNGEAGPDTTVAGAP